MPRRKRFSLPGVTQHVVQRGNNRQLCFVDDHDRANYASLLKKYCDQYHVVIHAWVFMSNHVHLLVTPHQHAGVSRMMQSLGREYVRYFNDKHKRTGTLWEGRFHASLVESSDYTITVYRYIELNPVRASLVAHPAQYHWSSYHSNARGLPSQLITHHSTYLKLAHSNRERQEIYRGIVDQDTALDAIYEAQVQRIRAANRTQLAFAREEFLVALEEQTGISMQPKACGRKPKKSSVSAETKGVNRNLTPI